MEALELAIARENTDAFIAVRPSTLVLTPAGRVRTPAGGWRENTTGPRAPQVFRIIELGMEATPPQVKMQDGTLRSVSFWLLGSWNAQVANWDKWQTEDGRDWWIADVIRNNEYETRAVVVEYGE